MGLLNWLVRLFAPRPIVRDVSGLSAAAVGEGAAVKQETVDTRGGPLKAGHLRRALRDPRLLPKPKVSAATFPRRKKPKIFSEHDVDRLFSQTLRTRDRNVRDLAVDLDQLRRHGLPEWTNEQELATALGLTVKQLRHYSLHRQRDTTPHYVCFAVRKRSGGQRLIYAPKQRLKAIQRTLDAQLTSKLPVSPYAHGFRKGRSIATNAAPHVNKAVVIKLDIADCFPTIHFGRVRGLLVAYGYSYPLAQTLAVLMTEAPRQPVEIDGVLYHVRSRRAARLCTRRADEPGALQRCLAPHGLPPCRPGAETRL